MARDYKHRAEPKKPRKPAPSWVWLLAGFLLGVFTTGLVWLKAGSVARETAWIGTQPAPASRAESPVHGRPKGAPGVKPNLEFDFYTMLPEMEVVVPDEELIPPPSPVNTADKPENKGAVDNYILQVASFRKTADADRLKAELAFLGYRARVQKADVAAGETWYRVRIGPFTGTDELQRARQKLALSGHKGLVIRVASNIR